MTIGSEWNPRRNAAGRRLRRATAMATGVALAIGVVGGSAAAAPAPRADLGIGISDNPDPVGVHAPLSYTVSVTNWGPSAAKDVTVVDKLPHSFLASSATTSAGSCKVSGRTVSCHLGGIGVGTAATTPTIAIAGTPTRPGRITDSASVSSPTVDPVHGNDLATESTTVQQARTPTCHGQPATIVGTPGPDLLLGTRGNDVVVAMGGDDVIRTFAGEDLICAGGGNDRVKAGIWADRIYGGPGADRLIGGGGRDRIAGNGGRDLLLGRGGPDLLLGGAGFDRCRGGRGGDRTRGYER
jgi:uncharacterized repeat protein (TIGR01451 family)